MAAIKGEVQIRLLDLCGKTCRGAASLNVDNHDGHLRHDTPAYGFAFKRDSRTTGTGDSYLSGITSTQRQRDGSNLVFALDECATVLRQLAPEDFHDVRPRGDRVSSAEAHAGCDDAKSKSLVPVHHDLFGFAPLALHKSESLNHISE
ncbi:hypothetical protein SDC9_171905 [bioreactor metagenome]|uniref:Uncharacterized protein n=1 Tax=bioreactor metagenome TaxID=1076179 RepID=A0A645GEC9_9ZZZZ